MELKATLQNYTEPEFQALVDRIWAVDLTKQDHDRLINHFDRIVGHPQGANLLFYPADDINSNSSGSVVYYVKDWHHKQGRVAFKGEGVPTPIPAKPSTPLNAAQMTQKRIAQSLTEVQKIIADLTTTEHAVNAAFHVFDLRIKHVRSRQNAQVDIREREADIRALETAELDARLASRKYEFWKMRVEFKRDAAQRDLTYARADQAQWQSIAQQISAAHAGYQSKLNATAQTLHRLQVEAEALLVMAQAQLVRQRNTQGVGPTQAPGILVAPLSCGDARPSILVSGKLSQALEAHRIPLLKALRSAVAEFTWQNTSGTKPPQVEHAAVVQFDFSSRAETEMFGLSVPLSELLPTEGADWQGLAATRAEVDIPFRMHSGKFSVPPGTMSRGVRETKSLSQVSITPTTGHGLSSKVRVRAAVWDEPLKAFSFTADGVAAITVNWVVPTRLEDSPVIAPAPDYRLGFLRSAVVPLLESSKAEDVRFDDYVVVFPADSGLAPIYLMFRDRNEYSDLLAR
ncbi:colicin immunity protein [Pseudomonas frederiksbergensis]|uniref:Colicin immunity protein n=1 Tax=Pseudomonas frederiksbergensis TaxID=104087 RepID=A0A423KCL5_9PSED|nr:bacteriocin immunity protein [Pseudomonas frederiksbergensis]RON50020.1 colicin immunity protein [Pseudomonas frederiksbergensis]